MNYALFVFCHKPLNESVGLFQFNIEQEFQYYSFRVKIEVQRWKTENASIQSEIKDCIHSVYSSTREIYNIHIHCIQSRKWVKSPPKIPVFVMYYNWAKALFIGELFWKFDFPSINHKKISHFSFIFDSITLNLGMSYLKLCNQTRK